MYVCMYHNSILTLSVIFMENFKNRPYLMHFVRLFLKSVIGLKDVFYTPTAYIHYGYPYSYVFPLCIYDFIVVYGHIMISMLWGNMAY